jgi:hypothetical protein
MNNGSVPKHHSDSGASFVSNAWSKMVAVYDRALLVSFDHCFALIEHVSVYHERVADRRKAWCIVF